MATATSPLRYPGGKSRLINLVAQILRANKLEKAHYAEPYAGGCGLALGLMYEGHVSEIHINDIDPSIWSFWECVLNHTDDFIAKIEATDISIDEWYNQREIFKNGTSDDPLALGFSVFFLNRTNRSGIIKDAGVIGGLSQTGTYKLDCRFNKMELIERINRIKKYRGRIHLYNQDALDFISERETLLPDRSFFCIDPPYFNKGSSLYTSAYGPQDHKGVADLVMGIDQPWVVTYDNADQVRKLYKERRQFLFDINYSVQTKRVGTELLIASKGLRLPKEVKVRQVNRPQYRASAA